MPPSPLRRRPSSRAGFSIAELAVVITILLVGLGAMTTTLATVTRLGPTNRETSRALDAARGILEEMRGTPFHELVARYNADPADDPGGAGTAPGAGFAAPGLDARPGDPDGLAGVIELPIVAGELREDLVDPELGLPRDLDGDGVVDGLDHSLDFEILPVRVRIEWSGRTGDRSLELYSSLVRP